MTEPLRYGSPISQNSQPEIAFVTLRYKRPRETQSQRINATVGAPESFDADDDLRFAAAIARFGQLLRDPGYLGTWSWWDALRLAEQARGADRFGHRVDAILLMRLAQSLSLP